MKVCSRASTSSASLFLSHYDVQLFTDSVTSVAQTRSLLLLWENQSTFQRLHNPHIKRRAEERRSRILRDWAEMAVVSIGSSCLLSCKGSQLDRKIKFRKQNMVSAKQMLETFQGAIDSVLHTLKRNAA